ncbi:NfeD family protein [Pseudoalteromonas obscura]|uniref:NfeD family protein n=1 Tax=Pseudoalteromonas obscura TaxID=3048491 RepID=A0ABT7EQA9_9GAMM|nr:NfeD family protein [Pseudoalteromonas sp. P94(2023)]MDK2597229.1 NfeD family protein [Pseudoalteromonas sp. P94(2023)]
MAYLTENLPQALIIFGLLALSIEVIILGFSTFVLFFLGLSLVASGTFMYFGLVEPNLLNAAWINGILTAVLALLLWKPLKAMQAQQDTKPVESDFAEISFTLEQDLTESNQVHYQYSGIQWQIKSKSDLPKGTHVKVIEKSVGILWVTPVE